MVEAQVQGLCYLPSELGARPPSRSNQVLEPRDPAAVVRNQTKVHKAKQNTGSQHTHLLYYEASSHHLLARKASSTPGFPL